MKQTLEKNSNHASFLRFGDKKNVGDSLIRWNYSPFFHLCTMYIVTGILFGLTTLLFIGPVLFYLISSTISGGKKAGVAVALGILAGDIICAAAAIWGGQQLFNAPSFQWWVAFLGGMLLLVFGGKYLFFSKNETGVKTVKKLNSWWLYFINGFAINFFNPFVFAVWFGFATYNRSVYTESETIVSMSITLFVVFASDVFKAYFSEILGKYIKSDRLIKLYRIFGLLMLIFAIRLLFYALYL